MTEQTNEQANQEQASKQEFTQDDYNALKLEVEKLRKHSETLLAEKKAEQEKRKAEQAEKDRLAEETARKKGDFETLESQYKQRISELENTINEQNKQRDLDLVKSHAEKLASSLSDNPNNQAILQMVIEKRLSAKDGQVKVLDDGGAITISTLDDLANELKGSGKYDSLIVGVRASGTGSTGTSAKQASDYSESERITLANNNPALFHQLFGV
ncbi:hypothetical protein LU293_04255 [Moraxella nasovis]|uniref:hypothetical protein n=1 Tax=Moraxella nasovis TaxID=2904121 RepID=UPI001F620B90|nr:hypothetical protein [Moraxella nasovis]UNU74115.1 hypothetical protein LU293_04255 [Moraxella nasovis]